MAQASERITFTAPAELAAKINEAAEADGCSRSEFLRKAMDKYIRDLRWEENLRYGRKKARELGIRPEDVDDIVHEVRDEMWREQQSKS